MNVQLVIDDTNEDLKIFMFKNRFTGAFYEVHGKPLMVTGNLETLYQTFAYVLLDHDLLELPVYANPRWYVTARPGDSLPTNRDPLRRPDNLVELIMPTEDAALEILRKRPANENWEVSLKGSLVQKNITASHPTKIKALQVNTKHIKEVSHI